MSKTQWRKVEKTCEHADVLHYKSCGLDNIYLVGGFTRHKTRHGSGISIQNVEGLHLAIADMLIDSKASLTGKPIKFLRKEMKLTQVQLAALLKVDEQSVARWEKGEFQISGAAEIVLRGLYREYIGETLSLRKLSENVDSSRELPRRDFEPTPDGWWHLRAA
jgi:putative transcriptional regulator